MGVSRFPNQIGDLTIFQVQPDNSVSTLFELTNAKDYIYLNRWSLSRWYLQSWVAASNKSS